jgi:Ca-activated chloride channel family protein
MNFAHPRVLWFGLLLLPLLALFFWYTWRRRQELIAVFVQNKALAQLALGLSIPRQKLRRIILLFAVAFLLLGMAGPQFGFTWEEAAQRGRDIIIAIDTSRSMLATDVQPDRLTRAKFAALDLLKIGKFDRFGLIAFAGSAFLQCPLTFDDEAFRQSVQILQPGVIPQGGTALSEAIKTAREAFGTDADENHKILIMFTDGEDHEAQVKETAERTAAGGVRIFTVGVGTPGGELLRVRDEQGSLVYVKDDAGNVVKSRLNEQLLREIATTGKGFYLPLQGGNAMDILYQKGLAPLPTSERNSKLMKELKNQFYWPLAIGILLLIVEIFIPEQKRAARKAEPKAISAPAMAALILLVLVPQAHGSAARAQRRYNEKEYKSALSEYQELIARKPNDPRLRYNAGAAAYQASKFDEAVKQFQASTASPDLDLQQQSFYNLGNAEFRVGEADSNPQQRSAVWEQAIQHYDAALKLNPQDKDAQFNRELVKKKLEELKQEQQKDKDQKQDNKDKKDDKKDPDKQNKDDKKQDKDNKSDEQQKQDQQQQNNQSDQDKQEKQKSQEQKKQDQQKEQQQQQQQADQQKKDGPKDQASSQQGKESQEQKPEGEDAAAQYAQLGKMSPAQAKQLLDAQRGEEKALLFMPQDRKGAPQNRVFKDW